MQEYVLLGRSSSHQQKLAPKIGLQGFQAQRQLDREEKENLAPKHVQKQHVQYKNKVETAVLKAVKSPPKMQAHKMANATGQQTGIAVHQSYAHTAEWRNGLATKMNSWASIEINQANE